MISRNQASTHGVSTPSGKENHLLQLRLAARGVLHLQSPAMRPVVRVLPAFAALLVSSAFAQQPTPILPDSRLTPGDTFEISGQDVCVPCYTKKVRAVSQEVKREVYREYGITSHGRDDYEIDHLIPLELGYRLAYNGDVATDQLAVFQGASWKKA